MKINIRFLFSPKKEYDNGRSKFCHFTFNFLPVILFQYYNVTDGVSQKGKTFEFTLAFLNIVFTIVISKYSKFNFKLPGEFWYSRLKNKY